MQRLFIYIFLPLTICLSVSCGNSESIESKLNLAEERMETEPEYSLYILDSLAGKKLPTRLLAARHALLYSMALDKNYIDLTTDSIIAPALKYYHRHGTADEKLKTHYYRGVIYKNCKDWDNAMAEYVRAEKFIVEAEDLTAVGRLYMSKRDVYLYLYDTENAINSSKKAAAYYEADDNIPKYINALLSIANGYSSCDNSDSTRTYLNKCKEYLPQMLESQRSSFYAIAIYFSLQTEQDTAAKLLNEYIASVTDEYIQWLNVADIYLTLGKIEKADSALSRHVSLSSDYLSDPIYHHTKARVLYKLHDYMEAAEAYKIYIELSDQIDMEIFDSDAKFIEERYKAELHATRQKAEKLTLILLLIIVCLLTGIIIYIILRLLQKRKAEKMYLESQNRQLEHDIKQYKLQCKQAASEIANLKKLKAKSALDESVIQHIDERLRILDKFVTANVHKAYSETAYQELSQLMSNRTYFLESTRMSFMIAHPKFLSYLKNHGLTDWEIGCCCLYATGLRGKEISAYLNVSGYYKASSIIRKKLDLPENSTNLDKYLCELLHSIEG